MFQAKRASSLALALACGLSLAAAAGSAQAQTRAADVPSAHSETMAERMGDGALTTKVKTALMAQKGLRTAGIHVHSRNGAVYLSGRVPDASQKALAAQTAQGVNGVQSVHSSLSVHPHSRHMGM